MHADRPERISSRRNALFQTARKLAGSVRERSGSRTALLDGTRLISAYVAGFGLDGVTLLIDEQAAENPGVKRLVETCGRKTYVFASGLFREISQVESPEGVVAIVDIPEIDAPASDVFKIYLDGVQDPGNLGALLRTAAASGATSAWLSKGCADPWSPKCLRGGMGAQFLLPVRQRASAKEALEGFAGHILATSPRGRKSLYDIDLTRPTAFVFGSEGRGLSQASEALTTDLVRIPMPGHMESLNVGAAAAVCCFERVRQLAAGR
jgi:TrmH family RNA methyltransferase